MIKKNIFHALVYPLISGLSLVIFLLMQGCASREDLFNIARITDDEIPKVLLYDPEDSSVNVPLNFKIDVQFSHSMDTISVENSFSFSFNGKKYGAESGTFSWSSDSKEFIFSPLVASPSFTTVTITITNNAKSVDNVYLTDNVTWSFTTSDSEDTTNPGVSRITPLDGDIAEIGHPITIIFTESMLKSTVENSFYISSEDGNDIRDNSNGYFEWSNSVVTYYPDETLNSNNRYYIYLDKNGNAPKDLAGNNLSSYTASKFYTYGNEIYVSSSGDDSSNYGINRYSPFLTINKALDYAKNNSQYHTINIDSSTYSESINLDSTAYNNLTIKGGWNSDFTQQYGTTTISYSDESGIFVLSLVGVNNITINNLDIISTTTSYDYGAVNVDSCSNINLTNVTANGSTNTPSMPTSAIYIHDSSVTIDNCIISGGNNSNTNYGVYISGSSDQTIIRNSQITGGSDGTVYGIYIDGCSPIIENNTSISAGSTSSNPSYGIYITNSASPTIRDNSFIYGGNNSGGSNTDNTFGIYTDGGSFPDIYRNTIVGGEESEGGSADYNCGIFYKDVSTANLYNNFIIGGTNNTDSSNSCYGVYLEDSSVKIINNTINGGGKSGSNGPGYSIYAVCSSSWTINPLIINNVLLGGNLNTNYGIYLDDNTTPLTCVIYNNAFDVNSCTHLVSTSGVDINNVSTLEGTIGQSSFDPDPEDNIEYTNSDVIYTDRSNYDYHILSDNNNKIKNHGFSSSNSNFDSYSYIYDNQAALYDIDDEPRPSDYSKIDLGADEFAQ